MNITFSISDVTNLQIQPGEIIDFNSVIARETQSEEMRIYISKPLGIPSDKIFMHLSKVVGEEIRTNDVIAEKKSLLGKKQITSNKSGILKEINHEEGFVLLETRSETNNECRAFFTGQVTAVDGNNVTLKVKNAQAFPMKDVTSDFGGEILFVNEGSLNQLKDSDVYNKVVFIEYIKPSESIRLDVMGARGIITQHDIIEKEQVNSAQIKNVTEWGAITTLQYPYCIIDKKNATMYVYQQ